MDPTYLTSLLPGLLAFSVSVFYQTKNTRKNIQRGRNAKESEENAKLQISGSALCKAYAKAPLMGYLTAPEIEVAVAEVRMLHPNARSNHVSGTCSGLRFSSIDALEPTKQELVEAVEGKHRIPRLAKVTSVHKPSNLTYVDVVSVEKNCSIPLHLSKNRIYNAVQVGMSPCEYESCERISQRYEPLRAALAARGLNPDYVVADTWCVGYSGSQDAPTERLGWSLLCYREPGKSGNDIPYSRPIEGIHMRVSITYMKVIFYDDSEFHKFSIPAANPLYNMRVPSAHARTDLRDICITQPEGATFTVSDGNDVHWADWDLQIGFNGREGISLHGIRYQGRPVLHRLSMAEMVVPYGDPRKPHALKNAFDAGEDGMGINANSLVLGCDCKGYIKYFNGHVVNDEGVVRTIKNAICMHEEDDGIAYKHTDWRTNRVEVRRTRRLVISSVATIANYEYGFYWYFHMHGGVEMDVKLTGVLSTGSLASDETDGRKYGIVLNKDTGLYAPIHQHFFTARLDTVIDGQANRVVEMNVHADKEKTVKNPYANSFWYETTLLESELEAERSCNSDTARFWKVQSSTRMNATGTPTAYKLVPATSCSPFCDVSVAPMLRRAQFLRSAVWVTPFRSEELYPAGDFPNQHPEFDGLPKWTEQDRNIVDTDVVIWYNFGVTHQPRLEDWPVMPVEHLGFHFKPSGFLDMSPLMTLPREQTEKSKECCK